MKYFTLLLVMFGFFAVSATAQEVSVPGCPYSVYEIRHNEPQEIVEDYIKSQCDLYFTIQEVLSGNDSISIEDIQEDQENLIVITNILNSYLNQYMPVYAADTQTISDWLTMVKTANIVPDTYEVTEEEDCETIQNSAETSAGHNPNLDCTPSITITSTNNSFVGILIPKNNSFSQTFESVFGNFTVYRSCEAITRENIEEAFGCPVIWVEQWRENGEYRGLTGLALIGYDWEIRD